MKTSNWPGGIDRGHSNFTGRIPRVSKYDGQGHWAPNSSTPPGGWLRAGVKTAFVVAGAIALFYVGAAVGF